MKKPIQYTLTIFLLISSLNILDTQAQNVGDAAPDFSLQTTEGETFTLSENKGKVVFVFLFGYNCTHCLANGPNTQNIYEKFMNNPNFVAVGIDVWNGSKSSVESYKTRTGITYDLCNDGSSLLSKYSTTYDRILLIDQQGILRYKATSNINTIVANQVEENVENLLKGGATGIEFSEDTKNDIKVYPNPIKNIATIQTIFQPGTSFQLDLMDYTGRVLLSERRSSNYSGQLTFNALGYPAGIYYIRTRTDEITSMKRVVIVK